MQCARGGCVNLRAVPACESYASLCLEWLGVDCGGDKGALIKSRTANAVFSRNHHRGPPSFPVSTPSFTTHSLWQLLAKPTARTPSRCPAPCRVALAARLDSFLCFSFDSKRTSRQVAASRPVAFYASLAKRLLLDNATVELSAIGQS